MQNSRYQREAESKGLQSRHAYTITKVRYNRIPIFWTIYQLVHCCKAELNMQLQKYDRKHQTPKKYLKKLL
jgi:hypothetical protein